MDPVDALLASVAADDLPEPAERRELRRAARLSQVQVAEAVGVSRETVSAWETGRWEPTGEGRARYRRLLTGLQTRLAPSVRPPAPPAPSAQEPAPTPLPAPPTAPTDPDRLATPAPCVLCGAPATEQIEGFPQHLDAAECARPDPGPTPPPAQPAPPAAGPPGNASRTAAPGHTPDGPRAAGPARAARGPRIAGGTRISDLIAQTVRESLTEHGGDTEAATVALQRRAIPDAMSLLDRCRIGARYDVVGHPPLPDILRKKSAHGADDVWEARPNWTRLDQPASPLDVTALDINGAYLSALKTHLPLGALEHSTGNTHSRRRSGIHLVTPPEWDHQAYLPNPLGSRDEPGPVWVTEPTLRLLQRLATDQYGRLCDPPVILESWTSGATEHLFEKFRQALRDARENAIEENNEVALEYVKSMYSKFVSTMGESNFNRQLYRPDWMHIIRSQAFVNLWLKAYKAHTAGLTVMRAMGTDELHIAGEWRHVFTEGRGVSQVKVKDIYTVETQER
jgi:hypothetical protein